tara:strand:- start:331 stop:828 length:498 start_codon:yes stop_codon:yes gene_type:complete
MKKLLVLLLLPLFSFGQSTSAITAGEFPFYEDCIKTKTNNDKTHCIADKIKILIADNFDKNVISLMPKGLPQNKQKVFSVVVVDKLGNLYSYEGSIMSPNKEIEEEFRSNVLKKLKKIKPGRVKGNEVWSAILINYFFDSDSVSVIIAQLGDEYTDKRKRIKLNI